jgi:hypothetical protein
MRKNSFKVILIGMIIIIKMKVDSNSTLNYVILVDVSFDYTGLDCALLRNLYKLKK